MAEFTIRDVLTIHGLAGRNKGQAVEIIFPCPECGASDGACSATTKKIKRNGKVVKNVYNCKRCGSEGSMFKLHKLLTTKECEQNGLPAPDFSGPNELKKLAKDIHVKLNDKDYSPLPVHSLTTPCDDNFSTQIFEGASDEKCSIAYRAMIRRLTLNEAHKNDLLRRGLSDEFIKRFGFRTTPDKPWDVCWGIVSSGVQLDGVPGFYREGKKWKMDLRESGYFCPVYDGERNLILGAQIRRNDSDMVGKKKKMKYVWFTSSGKNEGTSSGSRATYLPGKNMKVIIITEGVLKATVIWYLLQGEVTVIGIPGISILKSMDPYLERFEGNAFVYLAFDMDKFLKPLDRHLEKEAYEEAKKMNLNIDDFCREMQKKAANEHLEDYYFKPFVKARHIFTSEDALEEHVREFKCQTHRLRWDVDKDNQWNGSQKGLDDFLNERRDMIEPFKKWLIEKATRSLALRKFLTETE